jgi:Fe-S oxidoreductase
MKTSKIKADQIKNVSPKILVTACENCHAQLNDINDFYKLESKVQFLSQVVADSLVEY